MLQASKENDEIYRHKLLLIAHRGDTIHFNENTLEAFDSAFLNGADGVEMDIQLRGNEILVAHNYLALGSDAYPRLSDVLGRLHSKGRLEIELKAFDTKILPVLHNQLSIYPNANIELTTSEIPLMPHVRDMFPKLKLGLIMHDFLFQDWMTEETITEKITGWTKMSKADIAHVPLYVIDKYGGKNLVNNLHNSGLLVHTHIFKGEGSRKYLADAIKWEVDQCTIDDISLTNG